MRDHMPLGVVEKIVNDHVVGDARKSQYTNGYLAKYAQDLAQRIKTP